MYGRSESVADSLNLSARTNHLTLNEVWGWGGGGGGDEVCDFCRMCMVGGQSQ